MDKLSVKEINEFATRPNTKRSAVQNFLMTVTNNANYKVAIKNLFLDACLYNWNKETVKAIKDGITLSMLMDERLRQL